MNLSRENEKLANGSAGERIITKVFDNSDAILRVVILASFGLMILGFIIALFQGGLVSFPGPSTESLSNIWHVTKSSAGLLTMSAGLLLFLLFPSLRVLLGLEKFLQRGELVNLAAALIVLAELIIGIFV